MNDEKTTIYISPEEDLTSVRERLEQISAHYITLVIPTETQLRSHVAWKLLRARVRELGKEVQIVSDSAQVRSVAKDVNFKVASSLEAPPTGKSRPPSSRPGRILGNRSRPTGSIQRPTTKRSTTLRSPERAYQPDPAPQWLPPTNRSFEQQTPDQPHIEQDPTPDTPYRSPEPAFNNDFPATPATGQHYNFHIDTSPPIRPLPPQYLDEEPDLWSEDTDVARSIREAASQSGGSEPETLDSDNDFDGSQDNNTTFFANDPSKTSLAPRMTPLPRPYLGENPLDSMDDALPPPAMKQQRGSVPSLDNFETQEHIIQEEHDLPIDAIHGPIEDDGDLGDFVIHSGTPPSSPWREPIAEDEQDRAGPPRAYGVRPRSSRTGRQSAPQPPLPPVVPGQGIDSDDDLPPSVPDLPTQMPPVLPAASGTSRPSRELPPEGNRRSSGIPSTPLVRRSGSLSQEPRRSGGLSQEPRRSGGLSQEPRRSGGLSQEPRRSGNLPPAASSRISGAMNPPNVRASGGLANQTQRPAANMPSKSAGLSPEQARPGSRTSQLRPDAAPGSRTGSSQLTTTGRNRAVLSRPGTRPGRGTVPSRQGSPSRTAAKRASRRRNPVVLLISIVAIALIVILVLLYWLLPTATVAVTLPAQNYSAPVRLIANPGSPTDTANGSVQETTIKKVFTINGTGKATGSTKVGTASATGTVFFTNNGDQQITIPSNVVISTASGTQFVTQDNIALQPKNSVLNRLPSLVQAQAQGVSGNVPAGSITIIPASTLDQIARSNSTTSAQLKLQVTNDAPTSGGGVGSAISVTQNDLNATQTALSSQLQGSVNTWIQQQLTPGDVAGKPVVTPTLIGAPKANTIETSGTFATRLEQSVEVPIVRHDALQTATIAQLNSSLSKDKRFQNYQIVSGGQQPVQIPHFTPVSNGLSMILNFKPVGEIIQKITDTTLQRQLASKSPANAAATLKSLLPAAQKVQVQIVPGWLPLTPIRSDNIHLQFIAGSTTAAR